MWADRLERFRRLNSGDRQLYLLALALLPAIALGLRLFGFRRVESILARGARWAAAETQDGADSRRAARIARLVAAAASQIGTSCLPSALALSSFLHREGISAELRIGVRKVNDRVEAHAWIEHRGVPLIDAPDVHAQFAAFNRIVMPRAKTAR